MKEFRPAIKSRKTDELLEIVSCGENWEPDAVNQAKTELALRNIPLERIEHSKYMAKRVERSEEIRRAKVGYTFRDFLGSGSGLVIFEVLFSWELRREGYLRKAKQQKYLRLIFILIIVLMIIYGGK